MHTIMLSLPPSLVNTQAFHNILYFKTEEKAKQVYNDITRWLLEKTMIKVTDDYDHQIMLMPGVCNGINFASSFKEHEFSKDIKDVEEYLKFANENNAQKLARKGFQVN